MKLELWLPAWPNRVNQEFDKNANPLYKKGGLAGHTGVDWGLTKGNLLLNLADHAYCYSTMNKDNPDLTKYRAVFTLVEVGDIVYEVSYGHCDQIFAQIGKTYGVSEVLATCGNTGDVYTNGVPPTIQQRLRGDGAHLHFQIRPCKKVTTSTSSKHYLSDGYGILKKDGFYYEVLDYDNGYNGCVDPMPFFIQYLASDYTKVQSVYNQILSTLTLFLKNFNK